MKLIKILYTFLFILILSACKKDTIVDYRDKWCGSYDLKIHNKYTIGKIYRTDSIGNNTLNIDLTSTSSLDYYIVVDTSGIITMINGWYPYTISCFFNDSVYINGDLGVKRKK
ncbi:MAG: hypothetical protein PHC83_09820 [Bacteroidales bacterium]|nr:hypothetical protein [Bacteroidales bacterium]MDD4210688.1 hypothetical protein [Bacteroidales bacterium]